MIGTDAIKQVRNNREHTFMLATDRNELLRATDIEEEMESEFLLLWVLLFKAA